MNSKETSRLIKTCLCITFLFLLFQCTFSEPIPSNFLDATVKDNEDGNPVDSIWMRPSSYADSDESNSEENNSDESAQLLTKYRVLNEQDRPSLSSPFRRANFWKRANFWRKRANFWRRDLAA